MGETTRHGQQNSEGELDQKIKELLKRIQTERKVMEASQNLRNATRNQDVLRRLDTQLRDAERSISYFEDLLRELQARKLQLQRQSREETPPRPPHPGAGPSLPSDPRAWGGGGRSLPAPPASSSDYGYGSSQPGYGSGDYPPGAGPAYEGVPRPRNYTNLDLIKADAPHSTAKISRMLHQLEFKLQVEMQYKKGIDKMARLYQADGDKKSRLDAESKRVESDKKIQLLQAALKRYKNLHILDDADDEEEMPIEGERKENLRKPLSGKLYVTIKGARELEHAPLLRRSSKVFNETTIILKIEGNARAKTHPSRTDRWNEDFEISVDKANEVEIGVYDKQANEHPVPIGLLWIRISDLVEALRRQKVGADTGQGGWVTAAGAMGAQPPPGAYNGNPQMSGDFNSPLQMAPPGSMQMGGQMGGQPEGVEAWFAIEPAGALLLHLNFVKENVRKRPLDAGGLGRQGALRKRKEEVHEMNGHKFVQRQFYQIILCAFCNEFLLNALGYQCEDCRYTCHKKCYEKVVTKCISKSNNEEGDEEKINHRIPHRFETITNIGANWCCHCGYMLPLGRKNARKCSECDITCHASCAHLVPDFCGMSMETANQLLANWRDIKTHQKQSKSISQAYQPKPSPQQQSPPQIPYGGPSPPPEQSPIETGMNRLSLDSPSAGGGYGRPVSQPPDGRVPQSMYGQGYPNQYPVQQQPPPMKPSPGRVPVPYDQQPSRQSTYDMPTPSGRPDMRPDYPSPVPYQQQPGLPPKPDAYQHMPAPPPPQHPYQTSPRPQPQPPMPERTSSMPSGPVSPAQRPVVPRKRKVGLDDFNFLAVLGKGNFGKVMLAEEKKTSQLYAIKVLKKDFIIDNDEVESTRSEKRVFLAAARERHPFLLGLHSCFQTETRVYFVMEYVSGGDLMLHIQRKQFSLRQAKFYACEVLLALEYFHANGIIYRDLKLDNILLTLDGHVKVADYGLCKEEMWFGNTTSTFCGTPEFMAPEILLEQRYGRAVDWWAFGVLTYEMLLGQSPFRGDDEDEIFDAILEDEPLYPITMPRDAVSILQKLLTRDPARRLGSGQDDANEIKRHPFFKDVNWDDVFNMRIPPPYFPTINGQHDTSNFDQEFTREQPTLTPVLGHLSARDQQEFNGFSWVAAWADI